MKDRIQRREGNTSRLQTWTIFFTRGVAGRRPELLKRGHLQTGEFRLTISRFQRLPYPSQPYVLPVVLSWIVKVTFPCGF